MDLGPYLDERRRLIEKRLAAYMEVEHSGPPALLEAMRYSLLAPGKRFRPLLVLMAAEACGGRIEDALPAACAVEMVHTYSLIHDDLPSMDDDDLRRGQPTCHKKFGEATAILAGDALLTMAFQALSEDVQPPALAALCCRELARGAGAAGMVGGQMEDLAWEQSGGGTPELLEAIHQQKTGALFRAALRMGSLIGAQTADSKGRPEFLAALDRYAGSLGLAFQISDDLLDVESTSAQTGKRVRKDAARGKLTYPGLLGVTETRKRLQEACREARAHLSPLGEAGRYLADLVQRIQDRDR